MKIEINGASVYVATGSVEWQRGQPLLLLVHGASLDHTVWTLFSRYFARNGYNVAAPDLSGHGRSGGELLPTIDAMSDWLMSLVEQISQQCKPSEVNIAGHSMGSLVALDTASKLSRRLQRLLLMGTAVPMGVGDLLLDSAHDNKPLSRDIVSIFGHAYVSRLGGNPIAGISVMQSALRLMEQAGDGVMYNDLKACADYQDGLSAAAQVTAPTTLILGEKDQMTPAKLARALVEALPVASVTSLPGCGHMMMAEQPEETLQAMKAALAGKVG